ncbi:MAG: sugar transferase [Patescibacteria group bacterium]
MKKGELIFSVLLVPVDFVMLLLAGIATYALRTQILDIYRPVQFSFNLPLERYLAIVIVVALLFLGAYALSGLYALRATRSVIEEFFKIAIASSAGMMAIILYIFLRQELFYSRFLVVGAWLMAVFCVSVGRYLMRKLQKFLVSRYDFGVHRVMIIGNDELSQRLVSTMQSDLAAGYRVVKQLENPEVAEVKSAIGNPGIDEVILANPSYPEAKISEIVDFCREHHLIFRFVPNLSQSFTSNFSIDTFTGVPLVEFRQTRLDGWGNVAKRITDVVGSLFGLIILFPMFAVIAFAIKWESAGPVFVRLERVSRNRHFRLVKFRSMVRNAEELKSSLEQYNERHGSPLFKMRHDPRITPLGRFLRKYRLDEFPQLWNVLVDDISLVGPRPHEPAEIAQYEKHHKRVLAIPAGITGLAQISGSSDLPFEEEVALDTFYIENWSFFQDVKILIFTLLKLVRDRSAV